jgi:hypothetical protein
MTTLASSSRVDSVAAEYGIFWQQWPQFEQTGGDRRLTGLEIELIGAHASALNHVDPACPKCHYVRSVLLKVAYRMLRETFLGREWLRCEVDPHWNSILCLPALANRAAVSVSLYIYWNGANGQASDADLTAEIKTCLDQWGIHQR